MDRTEPDWAAELAAAQAWWREAGVDTAFVDAPRDWLAEGRPRPPSSESPRRRGPQEETDDLAARGPRLRGDSPVPEEAPRTRIGGDPARWPQALDAFAAWWLTEATLDPAPAAQRVPPAGPGEAALMVLVAMPEEGDAAALLSGPQGRLLEAMLRAFGTPREAAYVAAALPRRVPAPDWTRLAADGLGAVVAHHVALAAPKRLIVLGRDLSPLLGHDPAQAAANLPAFNHDRGSVPIAVFPSLEALLTRPALKRGVWTRWLEWTGTGCEQGPVSG